MSHDHLHVVLDQRDGEAELAMEPRDGGAELGRLLRFMPAEGSSSSRRELGSVASARANSSLR